MLMVVAATPPHFAAPTPRCHSFHIFGCKSSRIAISRRFHIVQLPDSQTICTDAVSGNRNRIAC